MLQEIGSIRQDSDRGYRRWFQDEYFDLYTWQDEHGNPVAFQLCYDRSRAEGVVSWSADGTFRHARVDGGEQSLRHPMAPILRSAGTPPYFRIYNRFLDATQEWGEPTLRGFLLARLREYRAVLFGTHRRPRRRAGEAAAVDSPTPPE